MRALSIQAAVAVLTFPLMTGVATAAPAVPPPMVTEAADEASAIAAARESGRRVEVLDERTETAQVFANPSGTLTLEQHTQPVRVRRGNDWVPVNRSLRTRPDGAIAPIATTTDVVFSGGGDAPLVRVPHGPNQWTA